MNVLVPAIYKIKSANLSRKKMLTLKKLCIGNLVFEYCLLTLEKYVYHINEVHILLKYICGNVRKVACISEPRVILFVRDYTERFLRVLI